MGNMACNHGDPKGGAFSCTAADAAALEANGRRGGNISFPAPKTPGDGGAGPSLPLDRCIAGSLPAQPPPLIRPTLPPNPPRQGAQSSNSKAISPSLNEHRARRPVVLRATRDYLGTHPHTLRLLSRCTAFLAHRYRAIPSAMIRRHCCSVAPHQHLPGYIYGLTFYRRRPFHCLPAGTARLR